MLKYSSAATAALGFTGNAGAASVYVDVTGWSLSLSGADDFADFTIDLNGDSQNDFSFSASRAKWTEGATWTTTSGSTTFTSTNTASGSNGIASAFGMGGNRLATAGGWLATPHVCRRLFGVSSCSSVNDYGIKTFRFWRFVIPSVLTRPSPWRRH